MVSVGKNPESGKLLKSENGKDLKIVNFDVGLGLDWLPSVTVQPSGSPAIMQTGGGRQETQQETGRQRQYLGWSNIGKIEEAQFMQTISKLNFSLPSTP